MKNFRTSYFTALILLLFSSCERNGNTNDDSKYFFNDQSLVDYIEREINQVVSFDNLNFGYSIRGGRFTDKEGVTCTIENAEVIPATDSLYRIKADKIAKILREQTPVTEHYHGFDIIFTAQDSINPSTRIESILTFKYNSRSK
ncbi:hypothetical protein BST97_04705 [Nonlabens spongiae]|uniref:Uncharacterized protein n=1 Tax=Nonlabens spongiae TaxID=331648 RepID=A0A1W6MIA0_9FLAO|nr:hypothetical protein [Nonlabens spongiae]ARN77338.1 hypothetical protein BST97_04705 [Nonlabens spongiae]